MQSILALAYLIVFGSIVGYTAYLWLLKTVEPAKVSTNFYVNPVIAIFAGWLVADEPVTLQMVIAAGVILLGVAVINIRLPRFGPAREGEIEIPLQQELGQQATKGVAHTDRCGAERSSLESGGSRFGP